MGDRRRHAGAHGTLVGRYLLGRVVGKGVSSEVRLATDTANNELVALKIMQKEWIWKNDMSSLVRREIDIMRELDHPCVVKLIEVFNSETHVFMAMEAVAGRELHEDIMRHGRVDETRARDLFQQLMMAVEYLHSIGVAHRDLKLENVLLSDGGQSIKVTGFDLAARLDEWEGGSKQKARSWGTKRKQRRQQTACGTPAYAAPEAIDSSDEQRYDARCVDTWCAGVCLYTLVTGNLPFQGSNVADTLDAVRTKEPKYPKQLSPLLTDLLQGMLHKDPSKRLTVDAVLSHPWTVQISDLTSPQPGEIEDQEHLAEAARQAIREARLAASEAERAAAAAQAAETNAAKALAAVKLAAVQSTATRPIIKRSASADSHHRRSASVDSHLDAAAVTTAESVRQDHEWSSRGHERTLSADDSVYAGGGGSVGAPQSERLDPPPPPPVAENGEVAGGGGANGSGVLVATKASAWQRLIARRTKFGRSQSAIQGDGSAGPADGDGGPVVSKIPQREASQREEPRLPKEGARKPVHLGRLLFERSLSSAFAATSSSDSVAVTRPPPIEQSMPFDLTVSPGNGGADKVRISNNPHLIVPDEVETEADAVMTPSKLAEPAAAEAPEPSDVRVSPQDGAVHKTPGTAEAQGGDIPYPTLSTVPTMSMSPPRQDKPSNTAGFSAPSPPGKEGGPSASSSAPVLVSPVGTTSNTTPATKSTDTAPGQQGRPSALHRSEYAPSSEPSLVTPASSSTSQPPADSPAAERSAIASVGSCGSAASAGSRGKSLAAEGSEGEAASRKVAEAGSVVGSSKESPLPAAGGEAVVSRGASEVAYEGPDGEGGVEGEVAGDVVRDAGAEANVDEGVGEAPVKKEAEKADGTPPVLAREGEKPSARAESVTATAATMAMATEQAVNGTAGAGGAEARYPDTAAAATPSAGAAAGRGSGAAAGVAVAGDGGAPPAAAAAAAAGSTADMEASAKTRPLLRKKRLVEPSSTKPAIGASRSNHAPAAAAAAAAATPKTKAGLPVPTAGRGGKGSQEAASQSPVSAMPKASEVSGPAEAAAATPEEPKADPSFSPSTGGPLAPAAGDSLPSATDENALPTAATVVSPRAVSGVNEEPGGEDASVASRQEACEPSAELPAAEATEKAEIAGQVDQAVASSAAEAAASSEPRNESEPLAEPATASDEAQVESSTGAEGAVPVTAGDAGEKEQPGSTSDAAVYEGARSTVSRGTDGAPASLEDEVTRADAEHPVPTDKAAFDEPPVEASGTSHPPPGSPSSPPSYDELCSHPSEEEGEAKDEDATGDVQEDTTTEGTEHRFEESHGEAPDGQPAEAEPPTGLVPADFVALDDAIAALDNVSAAPATAARSAQRAAENGGEEEEEEEDEEEQSGREGGVRPPSRSPTRGAVVWESINPFDGSNAINANGNGNGNSNSNAELSSRSSTSTKRSPKVYQPSTFKELMTGIKDTLVSEEFAGDCDDDDAESRYRGGEQEVDDIKGGAVSVPKPVAKPATNIRKLAEAESIWGSGPATANADADEKFSTRRRVSGKYLRNNGHYRPQSLQPQQQARGRRSERSKDRPLSTERNKGNTIAPAGEALGRPSAVFESPVTAKQSAAAGGPEKVGKLEKHAGVGAAAKPRKRGKNIGKKMSRMFGRKTEVN